MYSHSNARRRKKTQSDKNEVKVAGLVVGWYQRCSVDLFFRSAREELKVEGSSENHVCARLSRANTAAAI